MRLFTFMNSKSEEQQNKKETTENKGCINKIKSFRKISNKCLKR
jgi:hypothetical protein